jgi:hypothetical protein
MCGNYLSTIGSKWEIYLYICFDYGIPVSYVFRNKKGIRCKSWTVPAAVIPCPEEIQGT